MTDGKVRRFGLRIVSDGTPRGTRVLNAETGEELAGVRSVLWHIGMDGFARATIEVWAVPIDAVAAVSDSE